MTTLTPRQCALMEVLQLPDPDDLPSRRHVVTCGGDPVKQDEWRRYLPLAFVQTVQVERWTHES